MAYSRVGIFARLSAELDKNPTSTLADLSVRLHIHRHTVTTVVREKTGLHFRAWRDQRLFERSCTLLRHRGHLSIKEIGGLAGFNSTRAFDRFIKRHSGCRPTELCDVSVTTLGPPVPFFDKASTRDR